MTKKHPLNYTRQKPIPIFFSTDRNYVPILHVAIQSLVSNSHKAYNYNIHILGENLTEDDKLSYECYKSDNIKIFFTDMENIIGKYAAVMNTRYYYSKAIYFRTFIPDLFPQYEKVLYLDSDIAFNADAAELFNYNIGENYVGAVTCETVNTSEVFSNYAEKFLGMKMPKYFNSGVIIMNCKILRKIKFVDKFYDLMNKIVLDVCPDQDAYNLLCQGKVVFLPAVWNKIPRVDSTETLEEVKIVHYNLSLKPWRYDGILYGELFWNHAMHTPTYERLLELKRNVPVDIIARDNERMAGLVKIATDLAKVPESINQQIQNGKLTLLATKDQSLMETIKNLLSSKIEYYHQKMEQSLIETEAGDAVLI